MNPTGTPLAPATRIGSVADVATVPMTAPVAPFRLVIPRERRERLARRVGALSRRRACPVAGCSQMGLAAVLVDSEVEAVLCPRHELVGPDGVPIPGQPIFATAV